MHALKILVAFLISILVGWTMSRAVRRGDAADVLLSAAVSFGGGCGISSILLYIWSLLFFPSYKPFFFILLDVAVAAGLTYVIIFKRSKSAPNKKRQTITEFEENPFRCLLATLGVAGFLCLISKMFTAAIGSPHGIWDAWAIWNFRARTIFYGGELWRHVFAGKNLLWTHPDYPLLLPMTIARAWIYDQKSTTIVPIIVAGMYVLSTAFALLYGLSKTRGSVQAWLGTLVLICIPYFSITMGMSQYTDVPYAYYYLMACILIFVAELDNQPRFYLLGGLFAGFAMWTKNEGFTLVISIILSRILVACLQSGNLRNKFRHLRSLKYILPGILAVLTIVMSFKLQIAPRNDLFNQDLSIMLHKLTDTTRYWQIFSALKKLLLTYGEIKFSWGIFPLILTYAVIVGINPERSLRPPLVRLGLTLLITFSQYFVIYLITPNDLNWHLSTSADRLMVQLLPSFLFWLFTLLNNPLERLQYNLKKTGSKEGLAAIEKASAGLSITMD